MAKTDTKEPAAPAFETTYVLAAPVTYNGEAIKDIPYRRPKGRDVRAAFKARNSGGDMYIAMLTDICEQPPGLFDVLDCCDYVALIEICDAFLEPPKKPKADLTA